MENLLTNLPLVRGTAKLDLGLGECTLPSFNTANIEKSTRSRVIMIVRTATDILAAKAVISSGRAVSLILPKDLNKATGIFNV